MLRLKSGVKIYLATTPVDGRKAINGLSALIFENFQSQFMNGSIFVFYNQARDRIKCLFWDKNGFVLYHKRLERGKFHIKPNQSSNIELSSDQLDWLLAGLDFALMSDFPELNYEHFY